MIKKAFELSVLCDVKVFMRITDKYGSVVYSSCDNEYEQYRNEGKIINDWSLNTGAFGV